MASDLAERLRGGGILAPTRGRLLVLTGALTLLGLVLTVIGADDPVVVIFGSFAVLLGLVTSALFAFGWHLRRTTWLAREGVVFETPGYSYHVPWDEITVVARVGRSVLSRVQVTLRDVEAVVATIRRKRRGGKQRAEAWVRRLLTFNHRAGKCHFEFLVAGFGADAEELREILAGYVADVGRRVELKGLPVLEDISA